MQTYYLMENVAEHRMMIDKVEHAKCPTCETTTARSWIEAKRKFGFELTVNQEMKFATQIA